ncbi:MAG: UDP-N-acetylmuramoyl-L-alanine--D-glutamate ligase [Solirubrobacteraceae bacterium]|nr:UDP-N-acetylmuramoyl-L-alanine--D-glutamate ligase [Solirubrobacteraceae bacterium]
MRFSELDGLRVGVWGAGVETRSFGTILRSALPAARITVVVLEAAADAPELTDGARVVGADEAVAATADCDVVVRSPGVSVHRYELQAIRARGTIVTTATGLWLAERRGRNVLGLTATKGKSTTASLLTHLIAATGRPVQLAGNIGRPALELFDSNDNELAVVELSSYQIADLACGPQVAMASNLYPEHLQWHLTHDAYMAEKLRLLALPGVECCVVNALSPEVMAAPRAPGPVHTYGKPPGWHVLDDGSVARNGVMELPRGVLPLRGAHNALNVCGALTALEALEIPLPKFPQAFADFAGLPHRLQTVHLASGVEWVDDSISTTPESAAAALASFAGQPVILIGGGFDRGQDYTALGTAIAAAGARVLALPVTGERLADAVRAAGGQATNVRDLPAAVAAAHAAAEPGTVVLLSPAAPSFNSHADFQERGSHFRELAASLG